MIGKKVTLTKTFTVSEGNAVEILSLVQNGFDVTVAPAQHKPVVRAVKRVAVAVPSAGKRKVKPRRKTRKSLSLADRQQMAKLRYSGLTFRIIGKRFGVTDGRAWQIVNELKKKGVTA